MQKAYNPINWENAPSEKTPVNKTNLNKIDVALNEVDNRVITIDLTKMDKTSASGMLTGFELNTETGVITLTYYDGSNKTINTNLAKIALNISYDAENERLVLNMPDGTETYVDMSVLITQYEFVDSDVISFKVTDDGKVTADIRDSSITENKLRPNFLADIRVESSKAESSATAAATSESNAKTYMEKSEEIYRNFEAAGEVTGVKGANETTYRTGQINITAENVGAVATGGDVAENTITFDEAAERTNLESGEKQKSIMGKIKKWFTDLTAAAFAQVISSYPDLMANTVSGYLPDAMAVKTGFENMNAYIDSKSYIMSDINKYSTVLEWALANPNTFSKHMTMSNPFSDGANVAYGKYWCIGNDENATGLTVFAQPNNGTIIFMRTISGGAWADEWDASATKNDLLAKYLLDSEPIVDADAAEVGTLLHIDMHSANGIGTNAYLITIGGTSGQKCQFAIGINESVIKTRIFNTASWSDWDEFLTNNKNLHRQIAVGDFAVQTDGFTELSVGVAIVHHNRNFANTAYTAIVQQYTESDKTYLVNPPCIILGTKPIDGNSMYVYAINADGTAYTSSVWLSLVFVNKALS